MNANLDEEGQAKLRPVTRLLAGSPCFTVKSINNGARELFACGTETGKLLVADLTDGYEQQQEELRSNRTEEEIAEHEAYKHSYYLNFPQSNPERQEPNLLLPVLKQKVH